MPIHQISNGDVGLALYNGGSTPHTFREVYVCDLTGLGNFLQLAQLWRCTSANPNTGVYSWVQFCQMDKYKPTITPTAFSQTQNKSLAPIVFHYTDQSPTGVGYALVVVAANFTQGTLNTTVVTLAYGRATPGSYNWSYPNTWNSGDVITASCFYQDSNGYAGPYLNAANLTLF